MNSGIKLYKVKSDDKCANFLRGLQKEKISKCTNCHHYLIIDGMGFCRLPKRIRDTKFI